MDTEREPTFGEKTKMGLQAVGALARNPKAVVALVKWKLSERKQRKGQSTTG